MMGDDDDDDDDDGLLAAAVAPAEAVAPAVASKLIRSLEDVVGGRVGIGMEMLLPSAGSNLTLSKSTTSLPLVFTSWQNMASPAVSDGGGNFSNSVAGIGIGLSSTGK